MSSSQLERFSSWIWLIISSCIPKELSGLGSTSRSTFPHQAFKAGKEAGDGPVLPGLLAAGATAYPPEHAAVTGECLKST